MAELSEVVSDPLKLVNFVIGDGDLSALASAENFQLVVLGLMKTLLISNRKLEESNHLVAELNQRCVVLEEASLERDAEIEELKESVSYRDRVISDLTTRSLNLEEYSRRNTVTLTNVPFTEGEDVPVKVCQIINEVNVLPDGLDLSYISHAHRNVRYGTVLKEGDRPPTITLQFVRSMDKDLLMDNKSKWKDAHGKGKGTINILHALSPYLYNEMKNMTAHEDVEYVDYRGHLKHFAVKMRKGVMYKKIRCLAHLIQEAGL